jgi:hypothetical protein
MELIKSEYTDVQKARVVMLENRKWVNDHIKDLQEQYLDKWICVLDKKVVAFGDTLDDIRGAAGDKEEAIVLRVPEGIVQII